MILGGNLDRSDTRFASSKTFGNVPANVRSNSRILSLSHTKDSEGKSEWYWQTSESYQSLDAKYKLPNLLSWSAVYDYDNHSVILFGGRNGHNWSNKIFSVQLHPKYNVALGNIKLESMKLNVLLKHESNNFKEQTKKIGLKEAAMSQLDFLPKNLSIRKCEEIESLKIFSLNVHGWSSIDRSLLIDNAILEKVDLLSPDVCCFQVRTFIFKNLVTMAETELLYPKNWGA